MSNLSKRQKFYDDGNLKREKENFQGYLFEKVDLKHSDHPISFFRSDFRGANLSSSHFYKNNFANTDFIDSTVLNTMFDECLFRHAELYNSYFEESNFQKDNFTQASLVRLVFHNCNFESVKFLTNTIQDCKFENCKITNSIFNKNSTDNVVFENTLISNVDISSDTAINLFFTNCQFENVVIDADYIGSYFFKGNFLDNLKLKYRGKVFKLDLNHADLLDNLFKILFEGERYYEAINIIIQKNLIRGKAHSIFELLKLVTKNLIRERNTLKRTYQFDKIFKTLEYYVNTDYVLIDDYFKFLGYLEQLDMSVFDFNEQINFIEKIHRLKTIIDRIDFDPSFIYTADPDGQVLLEIKIDEADQKEFEEKFEEAMQKIAKHFPSDIMPYQVLNIRKGSLIYQILVYAGIGFLFLRVLKTLLKETRETIHESFSLLIDYKLNVKALESIKNIKGKDSIQKMKEVKEFQKISTELLLKKDPSKIAIGKLLPLLKSVIIHPNTLPDRE